MLRGRHREGHEAMEMEVEGMCVQLPEARRGPEQILPQMIWKEPILQTLQNYKRIISVVSRHWFVVLCYGRPGRMNTLVDHIKGNTLTKTAGPGQAP